MNIQKYNRVMEGIEKVTILTACIGITCGVIICAFIVFDLAYFH